MDHYKVCHLFITIYEDIKLLASLLDLDTRLHSLLSLLPFIHVRQFSVFSLQPGVEVWIPDQVQNNRFTKFQAYIQNIKDKKMIFCLAMSPDFWGLDVPSYIAHTGDYLIKKKLPNLL